MLATLSKVFTDLASLDESIFSRTMTRTGLIKAQYTQGDWVREVLGTMAEMEDLNDESRLGKILHSLLA